jgi:hypothetical protein
LKAKELSKLITIDKMFWSVPLLSSSLFFYLNLVGIAGLLTLFTLSSFFIFIDSTKLRRSSSPIFQLVPLLALVLLIRVFFSQRTTNFVFYTLLFAVLIFALSSLSLNRINLNQLFDLSWARVTRCYDVLVTIWLTLGTLFFISRLSPGREFTWLVGGDGLAWLTLFRVNQVTDGLGLVGAITGSSSTNTLGNLFRIKMHETPKLSFERDLQSILNFQILCLFVVLAIVSNRLQRLEAGAINRISLLFSLSISGCVLGMAGYNGFLSATPVIVLLIVLWSLAYNNPANSTRELFVIYLSLLFLILCTWSLLFPLVISQYLIWLFSINRKQATRIFFFALIVLLTLISPLIGSKIILDLDTYAWLTLPRGGFWQTALTTNFVFIYLLLSVILMLMGNIKFLSVYQLFLCAALCQTLFLTYDNPQFWGPWSSYYPQKLITLFFLSSCIWFATEILGRSKSIAVCVVVVSLSLSNFLSQTPNVLGQRVLEVISPNQIDSLEHEYAEALTFTIEQSDNKRPFVYWNYFEYPAENNANAWAGIAWERYPGNWSQPSDASAFTSNLSGPVGSRSFHNGDQTDPSNLCRLIELLPNQSIIYTRNILETQSTINDCGQSKQFDLRDK